MVSPSLLLRFNSMPAAMQTAATPKLRTTHFHLLIKRFYRTRLQKGVIVPSWAS